MKAKENDTSTGDRVGYMEPSSEIGEIGLQDIREFITVHKRFNGEYIIFLEDDWKAKVLMYRCGCRLSGTADSIGNGY
jgi:hypothetical protein